MNKASELEINALCNADLNNGHYRSLFYVKNDVVYWDDMSD